MTTMALLHSAPSVLKTACPFTARVNRSTTLVPSGRRARSVAMAKLEILVFKHLCKPWNILLVYSAKSFPRELFSYVAVGH